MNHGKAECHAKRVATPVEVEGSRIIVPVRRENNREGGELNQEVTGEEFEFAMQPALEQNSADAQLEDGMCDPKRVIKKSNFVAHSAESYLDLEPSHSWATSFDFSVKELRAKDAFEVVRATLTFPNPMFNALK
jgi:hypothetical protein